MKKDQDTSSRNLAEAGIELNMRKRLGVKLKLPCLKLERRLTDLLLLVQMGPGQVHCTVTQHYPKVLEKHPWVNVKYDPAGNIFHLTIRSEHEVFECVLQTHADQYTPEVVAAFRKAVPEICENGWFGKKETTSKPVPEPNQKPWPTVAPKKPGHATAKLSDKPRVTIVRHSAAAPAPAVTVTENALSAWLQNTIEPAPETATSTASEHEPHRQSIPASVTEAEVITVTERCNHVTETDTPAKEEIIQLEQVDPSPKEILMQRISDMLVQLDEGIAERQSEQQGLKAVRDNLQELLQGLKDDPAPLSGIHAWKKPFAPRPHHQVRTFLFICSILNRFAVLSFNGK